MFLCDTMGFFAYMIVMQYLTDKMTHAGLVRTDATWCIAILGIANTVSKLVCGFLCNKVCGEKRTLHLSSTYTGSSNGTYTVGSLLSKQ